MKKIISLIFSLFLILVSVAHAEKVEYVYDGDTFKTTDGKKVRLLNINTTETAKKGSRSEPFAVEAKMALIKLVKDKDVVLKFDEEKKDKYGRFLAYVYLSDGTFVNKVMLEKGLAHLYTFPENVSKYPELLKAENIAIKKKIGLWGHRRWIVKNANSVKRPKKYTYGTYQVYQGTVKDCSVQKGVVYLNFADNWRIDFSVEIKDKYLEYFKKAEIDPKTAYCKKNVRVRGILRPVNGPMISVTHPQQIEVLK